MDRPAEKAKPLVRVSADFRDREAQSTRARISGWRTGGNWTRRACVSGVPPEYLAAIIGVETYYGRLTGSYRVLDALTTLAFNYPARAAFFRDELEQFILLSRDIGLDPLMVKGSYAGAMGAPQFMPSNYRRFGGGCQRERAHRFVEQLVGRLRQRRKLSQGTWMERGTSRC